MSPADRWCFYELYGNYETGTKGKICQDSEERLKIVIEASDLGIWELNLQSHEFDYSQRYLDILGYEGKGKPAHTELLKRMYPGDLHIREAAFKRAFETGSLHYITRMLAGNNEIRWIEARGKVFYDDRQQPLKMLGTARDITEEKTYQQRMEESEKRFRIIADKAPVLIWMAGTDKQCFFFNKAWLEFTGRTMEENSNSCTEGIHPDDLERYNDFYTSSFDKREEFYMEYRFRRYDGEYRWLSDNGIPRFTAEGVFEGYIGACMDIHDRFVFEEKLKESESRLRIAALSSELGTWDYDPATQVMRWDNASRELFGVDADTPITLELFWSKMHPDDREPALQKMLNAMNPDVADTYDAEYRITGFPDNSIRWIRGKGKALFNGQGQPYLFSGTVLDITERKIALDELKESEQKFRLLSDSMPQFIWTGDRDGNLNYFNQSVYDYSGLTPKQISEEGWLQIVHPDDREQNVRLWVNAVTTGEPFHYEHRFRRHDGEYRWQLSRALPQKDSEGAIQMWVGTSTDIHNQKTFASSLETKVQERTKELQQTNALLEKSNHELEQFAYIASHDLQEPLRKIQVFSDVLQKNLHDEQATQKYFNKINSSAQRMADLIKSVLNYSRLSSVENIFADTDLNEIVDNVKIDFELLLAEKNGAVVCRELPVIKGIPLQLTQLFSNLISNSLKFSDKEPLITITSQIVEHTAIAGQATLQAGKYVDLLFKDNGIGFEQQYADQIFTIFQRLHGKHNYAGTGIGLALCKKIVENHHGAITAHSKLGDGASFHIYLPLGQP